MKFDQNDFHDFANKLTCGNVNSVERQHIVLMLRQAAENVVTLNRLLLNIPEEIRASDDVFKSYNQGRKDGWNSLRKSILSAIPQKEPEFP